MSPWCLWAESSPEGTRFYEFPQPVDGRLPEAVEYSSDGCWATLYTEGKPVRTWMWMNPAGWTHPSIEAKKTRRLPS